MVLVIAAAAFMAGLFLLFRAFEQWRVDLLPAIVINYFTAALLGMLVAPPWAVDGIGHLLPSTALLGLGFISVFLLTGVSAQRAGVAPTTVASKMSLVLTVAGAVILYHEDPGPWGWAGTVVALFGVALASWSGGTRMKGAWLLPLLLFIGNAIIDLSIAHIRSTQLTTLTEGVFPGLVFSAAGTYGLLVLLFSKLRRSLREPRTWGAGVLLGLTNYASLHFVVRSLSASGLPVSAVYPLINVLVILIGTFASLFIFQERITGQRWAGIALSVLALIMLLAARA
ncbi:MAG: DMT family transporter [Flavobacteriales bacterium]|nr:DMT family transporter [Flavobacteriales bacterium]